MSWWQRTLTHLLAVVLLIALVGGAYTTAAKLTLTKPQKIESWLAQSKFYDAVVTTAIDQAAQNQHNDQSVQVSYDDPTVRQAAASTLTPQQLQKYVDTFLDSNYAWLSGKTAKPDFNIDLTGVQQQFAQNAGQQVEARLSSLPVCTKAQLLNIENQAVIDPFTIPCRPPDLSASAEAQAITQQLSSDNVLLNQTAITPTDLDPLQASDNSGQPYYANLTSLPKAYQWGQRLPWIAAIVALLSAAGILFLIDRRRRGWRRIGIVLVLAGLVLIVGKFITDALFNQLEKKVATTGDSAQLQRSLIDFLHRAEAALGRIDMWFGIAFLILAVVIFIYLFITRNDSGVRPAGNGRPVKIPTAAPPPTPIPAPPTPKPRPRPKRPPLVQ